jgi:hypothetical protein
MVIAVSIELLPSDETAFYRDRFAFCKILFPVKEPAGNMELG